LGTALANQLAAAGHTVRLLRSETATAVPPVAAVETVPFSSGSDLAARFLERATDGSIAIFHAAAVGDFSIGRTFETNDDGESRLISSGKISTRNGSLWVELRPTPKLLMDLRDWYPQALVVGWKFEVDGTRDEVLGKARAQIDECRTDACVANGPAHGPGFTLLTRTGQQPLATPGDLIGELVRLLDPVK